MKNLSGNNNGIALTVVIIVLAVLTLMAGYILSLGYNRTRIVNAASGDRAKIYYQAQAGVHDATVRIRKNYTLGLTPAGGSFLNPAFNPIAYTIDVDGDGTMDTSIDIDMVNGAGQRPIVSTGLDV